MRMEVSLLSQFYALLAALVFGLGIGILYDIYRVFLVLFGLLHSGKPRPPLPPLPLLPRAWLASRKESARKRLASVLLFLLDTFFALMAGLFFAVFLYAENDGVFRLYLLVGAGAAFSLYLLTAGRLVFRIAELLAFYLHIALLYIAYVLSLPFSLLWRSSLVLWKRFFRPILAALFLPLFGRISLFWLSRRFSRDLSSLARAIEKRT